MSVRTFVDTNANVLIYAYGIDAGNTRQTGTLSTQVLQEFYVNVTRPGGGRQLYGLVHRNHTGRYSLPLSASRMRLVSASGTLIIAAARKGRRIVSEDLNPG